MGTSTDGQLCFGVKFEEDFEFPWNGEELTEWWEEINGCLIECPCADASNNVWSDYFKQKSNGTKRIPSLLNS